MIFETAGRRGRSGNREARITWPRAGAMVALIASVGVFVAIAGETGKTWSDDTLVASYQELKSSGRLAAAIASPTLPTDPPQPAFLEALAWFAAGSPDQAGALTVDELDRFLSGQVRSYGEMLQQHVEDGVSNDYGRTRTWKVIQKLTLLKREMTREGRDGRYPYPAITQTPSGDDSWEVDHTLGSPEEFRDKVCEASYQRPVLVKFGNTNCTQCMLFEMTGSVREYAERPDHKGILDVYKVWWGLQPDASFAGKIRDPERLDDLARGEEVRSSPTFVVYRNGRRHACGPAFPDFQGTEATLDACLRQEFPDEPVSVACAAAGPAAGRR